MARIRSCAHRASKVSASSAAALDEVFAVVQDQQQSLAGQRRHQAGDDVPVVRAGLEHRAFPQPECGQYGMCHPGRVGHRSELDQPDTVRQLPQEVGADLAGQPGLSGAARPDQGEQPVPGEQFGDRGDVVGPTDEAGELGPEIGAGDPGIDRRGQVAAEHRQLQLLQLIGWVDSQLVGEQAAGLFVRGECIRLSARSVERGDVLSAQPFPQRMCADQGFELGHHLGVPAELEAPRRPGPRSRRAAALPTAARPAPRTVRRRRRPAPTRARAANPSAERFAPRTDRRSEEPYGPLRPVSRTPRCRCSPPPADSRPASSRSARRHRASDAAGRRGTAVHSPRRPADCRPTTRRPGPRPRPYGRRPGQAGPVARAAGRRRSRSADRRRAPAANRAANSAQSQPVRSPPIGVRFTR